jgi:glycosyltransferase involved in cell wall biosynthesis
VTEPRLSLVICTRNRVAQLAPTLESVARIQCARPWELIVVDNGSSDGTGSLLDDFGRAFGATVHVAREAVPGLGRARNAGLAIATGEIVAFTDDDCYPAPDWLERIHECFDESGDLGFLGGRILLHDPTDEPVTILTSPRRMEFPARSFLRPGWVQGANMAFRRDALESVGGFDPHLGAGTPFACEDIDAAARTCAEGWSGAYDPRPLVHHHHRRKNREEVVALHRSYGYARGAYYAKCLSNPVLRAACGRYCLRKWLRRPWQAPREVRGAVDHWREARGRFGETAGSR